MAFSDTIQPHRNDGVARARSQYGNVTEVSVTASDKPEKFDPVVKNKIKVKKNDGLLTKLKDVFIANDAETVREYVFRKIFVPGAIDIFMDMVWGGMNMFFYEEPLSDARRGRRRGYGESRYSDTSSGRVSRTGPSERSERVSSSRRIDQLEFDDMAEAEEVLEMCYTILDKYKVLSIADVLDICNEEHSHTDCNWGWEDRGNARVRRLGRGIYTINFPRARRIE